MNAHARPRILAVLPDVPWPLNSGKRIRQWANVAGLAMAGDLDVVVAGLDVEQVEVPPHVTMRSAASVVLEPLPKSRAGLRLLSARPWRMAVVDWHPLVVAANSTAPAGGYDLVWYGSLDAWRELRTKVPSRHVIVDCDDIETEKIKTFLSSSVGDRSARFERIQRRVESVMWARIERLAAHVADAIAVCSEQDAALLGSRHAAVIPNCYPVPDDLKRSPADATAVMIGNFSYEPNIDAARFVARDVWPRVRRHVADAQMQFVGRHGKHALADLAQLPGVTVVGAVDDPGEYLRAATVALAPIRSGGGTRIKLIEAFAYGLPSVSTRVGCYGLDVRNGEELLIADSAADFADACVRVLSDRDLAARLGDRAHDLYVREYEPAVVISHVRSLAERVLGR